MRGFAPGVVLWSGAPMVARTRPKPRTPGVGRSSRRRKPFFNRSLRRRLGATSTGALAWTGGLLAAFVALLLLVDVPGMLSDVRDWLLSSFGLGLAILAGLASALAIALA